LTFVLYDVYGVTFFRTQFILICIYTRTACTDFIRGSYYNCRTRAVWYSYRISIGMTAFRDMRSETRVFNSSGHMPGVSGVNSILSQTVIKRNIRHFSAVLTFGDLWRFEPKIWKRLHQFGFLCSFCFEVVSCTWQTNGQTGKQTDGQDAQCGLGWRRNSAAGKLLA